MASTDPRSARRGRAPGGGPAAAATVTAGHGWRTSGADVRRVTPRQRRRRRAVPEPPGQQRRPAGRARGGATGPPARSGSASPPSCSRQTRSTSSPYRSAGSKSGAPRPPQRGAADQQRGGRHVGPGCRGTTRPAWPPGPGCRAAALYRPAQRRPPAPADTGGDHGHRRIGQMRRQPLDPAGRRHAVAVENATSSLVTPARPVFRAAAGPPLRRAGQRGAVPGGHGRDRGRVGRAVVHHHTGSRGPARPGSGRASPARSRTGITTVTSGRVPASAGGRGWARPASVSRRASTAAAVPPPGRRSSARARWPAAVSRSTRAGEPPKNDAVVQLPGCPDPARCRTRRQRRTAGVLSARASPAPVVTVRDRHPPARPRRSCRCCPGRPGTRARRPPRPGRAAARAAAGRRTPAPRAGRTAGRSRPGSGWRSSRG